MSGMSGMSGMAAVDSADGVASALCGTGADPGWVGYGVRRIAVRMV